MVFSKTEEKVYDLALPSVSTCGYTIYDVEYVKEGPHWFLRIFIDREEGVNVDDCEVISREVSALLDEREFIETNYFLEVSSPGIERVLRQDEHFKSAVGKKVRIKLYTQINGVREAVGELVSFDGTCAVLNTDSGNVEINKKNIAKANIMFDF